MLPQSSSEAATLRPAELESGSVVSSHQDATCGVLNWYRVLVTTNTLVFGLWKTVASYNDQNIISTTVDWLGAVFLSLLFFWVSECRSLAYTRWLFERQPTSDVYQISSLVSATIKCYVVPVLPTAHRVLTRSMRRLPTGRRTPSDGELPLPVLSGSAQVQFQGFSSPQQPCPERSECSVQAQVPPVRSATDHQQPQIVSSEQSAGDQSSVQSGRQPLVRASGAEQPTAANSMQNRQTQIMRLRRLDPQGSDAHTATLLTLFLPLSVINQTLSLVSQFDATLKQRLSSDGRSKSLRALAGSRVHID